MKELIAGLVLYKEIIMKQKTDLHQKVFGFLLRESKNVYIVVLYLEFLINLILSRELKNIIAVNKYYLIS